MGNKNRSWRIIKLLLFADFLSFLTEVFAHTLRTFLRVKAGRFAHGWILFLVPFILMILWNQEKSFHAYLELFKAVFTGIWSLLSGNGIDGVRILVAYQPVSLLMHYFIIAYSILCVAKLLISLFLGWKDKEDPFSKGTSIFYLLFSRITKRFSHTFYKAIWEPIAVVLLAVSLFSASKTFSLWLVLASICLFIQETADGTVRKIESDNT